MWGSLFLLSCPDQGKNWSFLLQTTVHQSASKCDEVQGVASLRIPSSVVPTRNEIQHQGHFRSHTSQWSPSLYAASTLSLGSRSNIPPKIIEQIANEVSAGIPTNQGNQYFCILSWPIISQGWTKTHISNSWQAWKTGNKFSSFNSLKNTWENKSNGVRASYLNWIF